MNNKRLKQHRKWQQGISLQSKSNQRGIGILEVLIALVVVSFGVLGMASLQLTGMKHSSGGFNRTKALLYVQGMSGRIRLNTEAVESLAYAGFDSASLSCDTPPAPYCQASPVNANAADCNPEQLAAFDLFTMSCGDLGSDGAKDGVLGTLPSGNLSVTCLSTPCEADSDYQITVSWAEGRSRTNNDEFVTRMVQVRLKP